jgi:2-dehydro-3-deoxyphosphogluconate aldolase/(4S)-4-hydroxy-2-oxoglutarate aldolase
MIGQDKIYPIIRCEEPEKIIEVSHALVDGGIRILEINIEHPQSYKAIEEVSKFAHVCAGGIITSMQADVAFRSGAELFSSPIFQMSLIFLFLRKNISFLIDLK